MRIIDVDGVITTIDAKLFSFVVQGTSFNFGVHAAANRFDLKVSHVESGRGVCEVSMEMLIGHGFDEIQTATTALCELVNRIGQARMRSVLAGAKPI